MGHGKVGWVMASRSIHGMIGHGENRLGFAWRSRLDPMGRGKSS